MEDFDLDSDLSFIKVEYELYSLGKVLEVVEDQITYLQEQKEVRFGQWLSRNSPDSDQFSIAHQEHWDLLERVYPRYLRYPFVISLWAVAELTLREASNYLGIVRNTKLKLNDIRGKNIIDQTEKYYESVLSLKLFRNSTDKARLNDLYTVRNLLAHSNGRLMLLKGNASNLKAVVGKETGLEFLDEVLIIDHSCLCDMHTFASSFIKGLIQDVRVHKEKFA